MIDIYLQLRTFCILFWLLQNFYMAIMFQVYERIYTLPCLLLMFFINAAWIVIAYMLGSIMLFGWPLDVVLMFVLFFVGAGQVFFWLSYGLTYEMKGITIAQILAMATTYGAFWLLNVYEQFI